MKRIIATTLLLVCSIVIMAQEIEGITCWKYRTETDEMTDITTFYAYRFPNNIEHPYNDEDIDIAPILAIVSRPDTCSVSFVCADQRFVIEDIFSTIEIRFDSKPMEEYEVEFFDEFEDKTSTITIKNPRHFIDELNSSKLLRMRTLFDGKGYTIFRYDIDNFEKENFK